MFIPYPGWAVPYYQRPHPIPARYSLLGLAPHAIGGFGAGPAPIEPGYLFFSGGHPIGGVVSTGFRGVSAAAFPLPFIYLGSGGPINGEALLYAGAPIGGTGPGRGAAPIGF
ncbi:MAG: hypothetical protein JWN15_4078 [Firmicutes bacterium]|nr:hypothetical protein [Bacillota bacterium]